jgi:hypothetical protein
MKNLPDVKLVEKRKEERNDNNSAYTRSTSNLLGKNILAAVKSIEYLIIVICA